MVLRRQEGGITHLQDLKLPWFHAERITKGGESLDDGGVLHVGDTDPTCAKLQAQTATGRQSSQISSGSDHLVITLLRCLAVAEVWTGIIFLVPSSMSLLQRPLVAN